MSFETDLKNLRRSIKNNTNADASIKRLKKQGPIDALWTMPDFDSSVSALMFYAQQNNTAKISSLLAEPNPSSTIVVNEEGFNALAYAVAALSDSEEAKCDTSAIDELFKFKPEIQVLQPYNTSGHIPLHEALESGNEILVKKLLEHEPVKQLKLITKLGDTAFSFVAKSGNNKLIAWLVNEYPFIIELISYINHSPLHLACIEGNSKLVWFLLQKGQVKDVMHPNNVGTLPLLIACGIRDYQEVQKKIIDNLLDHYPIAQLLHKTEDCENIFHFICDFRYLDALPHIIRHMQKNNIDIKSLLYQKNKKGFMPIHILFNYFSIENPEIITILKTVLEFGGVEQLVIPSPVKNLIPLSLAVDDLDIIKVEVLATRGHAQYLIADINKEIPLFIAIRKGHLTLTELLLKYGPREQLGKEGLQGDSPLCYAIKYDAPLEILDLLFKYSTKEQLIGSDSGLHTPLQLAVKNKHPKHFNYLMSSKYAAEFVNLNEGHLGAPPILTAVEENNEHATRTLLKEKNSANALDAMDWTPVHVACLNGNATILRLLLAHNGNIHLRHSDGDNCLDIAISELNFEIIEILKAHGAVLDDRAKNSIIENYSDKRDTYKKLKSLFNELPNLPESPEHSTTEEKITDSPGREQFVINSESGAMSSRAYLKSIGFDLSASASSKPDFNASSSSLPAYKKVINTPQKNTVTSFLNVAITSEHESIIKIHSKGAHFYCYLDMVTLEKQGCDIQALQQLIKEKNNCFEVDGRDVNHLDDNKGIYTDQIASKSRKYEFELKINNVDRVLLCQIDDLYYGTRYIKGGLHSKKQIKAVTSLTIEIQWPRGFGPTAK